VCSVHWLFRTLKGEVKATREAAGRLGIALVNAPVATPVNEQAYRSTFETLKQDQADGIVFSGDVESYPHRLLLVELAKQIGLPAIFVLREQAIAGGLMSYSTDLKSVIRTSAGQSAEILRGGNPSEMPYVQATRFELVINLKTARSLGVEMPTTILARADEVIE
jgi:putative tryptophan/tyrosine transport system substrate-binding protein